MSESTQVANFQGQVSIADRAGRVGQGSENVSTDDMAIPRIKLLQAISEQVQPGPMKLDGAEIGHFLNSATNELHTGLFCINLHFSKSTVVWKKRKMGGGMFGSYENEELALKALEEAGEPVQNYDISENPTHLLLLLNDEGEPKGIALMDMPGSKVKVSKRWNTMINAQEEEGNPRFGCIWQLTSVEESGAEGPFRNVQVQLITHAPDELYKAAEAAYDNFFAAPADESEEAA